MPLVQIPDSLGLKSRLGLADMEIKPTAELQRIRDWAQSKIDAGSEPPWAWYQYMKLIETIDAIRQGMASTTTVNSRQSEERSGGQLRLVASTRPQDASRPRPADQKIRMPM